MNVAPSTSLVWIVETGVAGLVGTIAVAIYGGLPEAARRAIGHLGI